MRGGSNPILRQTDSIRGLRAGLAICLQFQVRRYSTPLTAATAICRASVAAFGGSGTSSSNAAASDSVSVVTSNSATPANTRRRSAAATESPAAHSPTTNRETYTEKNDGDAPSTTRAWSAGWQRSVGRRWAASRGSRHQSPEDGQRFGERLPTADRSQSILNSARRHRDSAARLCSPCLFIAPDSARKPAR